MTAALTGNLRGIVAMVAAVGCFSLMDALLKTLAASYPAMQVAALRGWAALPQVAAYVLWRGEPSGLLRVRWSLHLLRGVLNVTMLGLFAYGRSWTAMGPWQLGAWYRPLAVVAVLGCGLLFVIGVQPPNEKAWKVLLGFMVFLAVFWIAVERRRFRGPPGADPTPPAPLP